MKTLSQRDDRWKNILLGTSSSTTIGSHGCTITCVAMLAGTTPDVVNEKLKSVGGYANTNLVVWSKINEALPNLEFEWRGYSYDNDRVSQAISDYGGCLVEVSGARIGGDKHWVLFIGNQKMYDPWTGVEKSTGWYGTPTGYAIIKKTGELVDNDALSECLRLHKQLVSELDEEKKAHAETQTKVDQYKSEAESRKKALEDFIAKLAQQLVLPTTSDQSDITAGVERLLAVEDKLIEAQKKLTQEEKKHEMAQSQLKAEIQSLSEKVDKQATRYEDVILELQSENQALKDRLSELETELDKQEEKEIEFKWLRKLLGIFK